MVRFKDLCYVSSLKFSSINVQFTLIENMIATYLGPNQPIPSSRMFINKCCQVVQTIVNSPQIFCLIILTFSFQPTDKGKRDRVKDYSSIDFQFLVVCCFYPLRERVIRRVDVKFYHFLYLCADLKTLSRKVGYFNEIVELILDTN